MLGIETYAMPSRVADEAILASTLSGTESYRLLLGLVAPRPIAWVSTLDAQGRRNLAPFSFFNAVSARPPTIVLGIGWHDDGRPKDTLANIMERREFVVCHVSEHQVAAMNATSFDFEPDIDEWDVAGLEAVPSSVVAPPRVQGAKAALECQLRQLVPIGAGPTGKPASTLVVAEVVCFHAAPGVVERQGGRVFAIDAEPLASVGRLGGSSYTTTRDRFELPRPVSPSRTAAAVPVPGAPAQSAPAPRSGR